MLSRRLISSRYKKTPRPRPTSSDDALVSGKSVEVAIPVSGDISAIEVISANASAASAAASGSPLSASAGSSVGAASAGRGDLSQMAMGKFIANSKQIFNYDQEKGIAVLKGKNGSDMTININNMRLILQELKPYQDMKTDVLATSYPELDVKFRNLIDLFRALYGVKDLYIQLLNVAKDVLQCGTMDNPLVPGTIGAFFCGCAELGEGGECSATCAGNLPHKTEEDGFKFCEYRVYYFDSNRKFIFLQDARDNKRDAIIEIDRSFVNFEGFTAEEITLLKSDGVINVQLKKRTGGTVSITESLPLEQFLRKVEAVKQKEQNEKNATTTFWAIVLVIIMVLIIILILCYLYYYKDKTSSMSGDSEYASTKASVSRAGW